MQNARQTITRKHHHSIMIDFTGA